MNASVIAAVGLGSNLGDRERTLRQAVDRIAEVPGVRLLSVSKFMNTTPVGNIPQPDFLNAALIAEVSCDAIGFMHALHAIEREFGRDRATEIRWGPRTLDLDLLLYGNLRLDTEALTLPHPRMLERAFVLGPLAEIAPALMLPSGATILQALEALRMTRGVSS